MQVMNDKIYFKSQNYNTYDTNFYWQKISLRWFVFIEDEHKPWGIQIQKDRLTLQFTGNYFGDAKFLPLWAFKKETHEKKVSGNTMKTIG